MKDKQNNLLLEVLKNKILYFHFLISLIVKKHYVQLYLSLDLNDYIIYLYTQQEENYYNLDYKKIVTLYHQFSLIGILISLCKMKKIHHQI